MEVEEAEEEEEQVQKARYLWGVIYGALLGFCRVVGLATVLRLLKENFRDEGFWGFRL